MPERPGLRIYHRKKVRKYELVQEKRFKKKITRSRKHALGQENDQEKRKFFLFSLTIGRERVFLSELFFS